MPLHSLLMGITSFAPERHIRMYANTIPEISCSCQGLLFGDIKLIFVKE